MGKISVVINTLNEERRLAKTLSSLKGFANDIVVVDMMSDDSTVQIAKKAGARVFKHKKMSYVEPARNFGIEKAKNEWVLVLDADERLTEGLKHYLKEHVKKSPYNYFRIPRKNIIFGKWMKHTGWWPDYNIRFFKKGTVSWNEIIHSVPTTTGSGFDIPADGDLVIIHAHYSSIEEYLIRMNRYTTVQAKHLNKSGEVFSWKLIITKPMAEFLSRYFAYEGYKDGVHGLAASTLQAFSELVVYLKLWQKNKFERKKISLDQLSQEFDTVVADLDWWVIFSKIAQEKSYLRKLWLRILRKLKYL